MKKFLTVFISIIICFSLCFSVGCQNQSGQTTKKEVGIRYFADASEMMPLLKQGQLDYGVLPEPAASTLIKTTPDKTFYRLSLQELYDKETKAYPQAVIMIKQSLLKTYPNLASDIENAFLENLNWTKDNIADAVSAINGAFKEGGQSSLKAPTLSKEIIERCGIFYQNSIDGKEQVKSYIADIKGIEDKSANMVDDSFFYLGSASGEFNSDKISVAVPDGAPALAIAKFINDKNDFNTNKTMEYSVVPAGDIGSFMVQGKGDIVVLPVNAASKIFAQHGYKMISVITHGNLYLMSTKAINNLSDLDGKTIGLIGQGAVPDLTFKSILNKNQIGYKIA